VILHPALAGLFCTAGLILLAGQALSDRGATVGRRFAVPYALAMALWLLLGLRRDSGALVLISLLQLASALALLAPRRDA
jgi:hypothetical protein